MPITPGEPSIANSAFEDGGTAEVAAPADPARRAIMIHVNGESDMWFNFLGDAADGTGFKLLAGERRVMYAEHWPEIRNELSAWSADTAAGYTIQAGTKIGT